MDFCDTIIANAKAAWFRKELIAKYGEARGSKIRYAEAFEVCEYSVPLTDALKKALFDFSFV